MNATPPYEETGQSDRRAVASGRRQLGPSFRRKRLAGSKQINLAEGIRQLGGSKRTALLVPLDRAVEQSAKHGSEIARLHIRANRSVFLPCLDHAPDSGLVSLAYADNFSEALRR